MLKLFISGSLIFFTFLSFAQSQVKYELSELSFQSSMEEDFFNNLDTNQSNLFPFYFTINVDDSASINQSAYQFEREVEDLKNRKIHRRFSKDLKKVYEQIHENFLIKYEELSYFNQVFQDGTYNCVSAVILYSLMFDELGIPYSIKETPTHVYLIADPNGEQILIETTDPVKGFAEFSNGFKENFISTLLAQKIIKESEIRGNDLNTVFERYYFGGKRLNKLELASLQYYNRGIQEFSLSNFKAAYTNFSKAHFIYPNEKTEELLKISLVSILGQADYSNWDEIILLPKLEKFLGKEINITQVEGEIGRMIQETLISKGNLKLADSAYNYTINRLQDSTLVDRVKFNYNYNLAVVNFNRGYYKNSYKNAQIAYSLQPNHTSTAPLLLQSFAKIYENEYEITALEDLQNLIGKYPKLLENKILVELQQNLLLQSIFLTLQDKNLKQAEEFRSKFEESISKSEINTYQANLLGNAYSMLCLEYFRRGYTSKARQIVKKGLSFEPENYQLKSARSMLYN
ncbi:hypothetical protein QYS49_33010 [Marivirga salinae]|uniref:Protein SirB1 N-terminal domain-containing protein n=1 Tax=Marivirga salinarum TaxID=3059078 RepID=A0AA51NC07_9BACT|nr:hypothetical protein [Marivirga sp. BDSF4-3]WMN12260.1 hypothetical protein QYS49_33010 [Marivirga sp. BDSF4-3]